MLSDSQMRLLHGATALMVDLDGCLYHGVRPADGAARLIDWFGDRLAVVSNNSTLSRHSLAKRLAADGIAIAPERLCLAGETLVDSIAERWPCARVMLLASQDILAHARDRGLILVDEDAEVVAVCRATALSYTQLAAAVREVAQGAALLASNADPTHRTTEGIPVPETGSLVAAIRAAIPGITPEFIGKPTPSLFRAALGVLGTSPRQTVMIGSNPETDGVGAASCAVGFIRVSTSPATGSVTVVDIARALERSVFAA